MPWNARRVAEMYNLSVYWVMAGSMPSYMRYCELPRLEGVANTTLALALGCGDPDTLNELMYQLLHGVVENLWKFNTTYTGLLPDSRAPRRTVAVAGALNAVPERWEMEAFNLTERRACGYVVAFTWHEKSVFTRFDNLEVKPACPGARQEEGIPSIPMPV
jgi:sulfur carrier protein ThiS